MSTWTGGRNDKEEGDRIVVVGGGSTGASTAYHLASSGQKNVVLVDRGQVASGTTSRSTALVRTHYSNEIVARMALYSLRKIENFGSVGESGFVRNGMLILASEKEREGISSNLTMLSKIGVKSEIVAKEEARRRFPEVDLEDSDYLVFEPESGYADPVSTANSYANKAKELGASLILESNVSKLITEGKRVTGVELSSGTKLACSKVILCTNVWTNKLLLNGGVEQENLLPLWAVAHPVLILKRPPSYQGLRSTVADFPNRAYYKPEGQSLFFGGSLDPAIDKQKIDPELCPSDVPFEYLTYLTEVIAKRIPIMKDGVMHSSYIGMYDMTPDQHPIIDSLSDVLGGVEGAYCCVGLSGHGFKLCPALGLINSEMLQDRDPKECMFDRTHFSLKRFKEGKEFSSKYAAIGTIA